MTSIWWLRRDLRLHDQPALHAAAQDGPVVALFVLDPRLVRLAGRARIAFLHGCLRAVAADLGEHGGRLVLRRGDPVQVVPQLASETGAAAVHVCADYGPYGATRDAAVKAALGGVPLVNSGSPYAVAPGRILKADGTPYQVFTPFYRAWCRYGWSPPAPSIADRVRWHVGVDGIDVPVGPPLPRGLQLPEPGERAALEAWRRYRHYDLPSYATKRDRPDLDATSHLSVYLKWGCLHPRTVLAELGTVGEAFRRELAWREFYAHVLYHWPDSARCYFKPELAAMRYAAPDAAFDAWCAGRTGYPIVDAGMRQLLATGWMHNRVRMIVASFLVKDLHVEWTHGARHFMRNLVDADLASNQHGWQWVAGTGTDPAPFFRIFNPIAQGKRFDPDGAYVRRWVPELREIAGAMVHEPWRLPEPPGGYPPPIVDHATERREALARYQQARAAR